MDNYQNLNSYYLQNYSTFFDIASSIIQPTPLSSFAYQRIYVGGEHLIFFTDKAYSKCFFETVHDVGPTFYQAIVNSQIDVPNFYVWPTPYLHTCEDHILKDLYHHNIWNGLTIYVRRKEQYIDCYYFAGNRECHSLFNFYLNNKNMLLNFTNYFSEKAKNIIKKDPGILGRHTGQHILKGFSNSIIHPFDSSCLVDPSFSTQEKFSRRELECIEMLAHGYGVKFIARSLNLSPRTIESYLQSVKTKTGKNYKDELIYWFHNWRQGYQIK